MKLSKYFGLVITFHSVANATSCTSSNAIPWAVDSGSDDLAADAIGAEISAEGEENASDLIGKRAAIGLDCTASETCVVYTDNTLFFCLDANTGDFHDNTGGIGNVITGEYTSSDGESETISDDETPTATASGSGSTPTAENTGSAVSCTSDSAERVLTDGSDGGGMDAAIQAQANCIAVAAVGTSSCSRKRASFQLECSSNESCILYGAKVLLCLEAASGDFHDEYEGTGNAYSGKYTAANGETQTLTGTMLPTQPATSTGTSAPATPTSSRTGDDQASTSSTAESQQVDGGAMMHRGNGGRLAVALVAIVASVYLM